MPDLIYSWQALERQPYGSTIWDIAGLPGESTVVFMIREPIADIERLPQSVDVMWKTGAIGMTVGGRRVMPVVILIDFYPLQSLYELWFNFYGEAGPYIQEAFLLLAKQDERYILFHDRGPIPVGGRRFSNDDMKVTFRGLYSYCKALPPWSDDDFDYAKALIQRERSVKELWEYLK